MIKGRPLGANTVRRGVAAAIIAMLSSVVQADEPERTIETYGGWELQCVRLPDTADGPVRACEIVQTMQLQGQSQPLTRLAIGRPAPQADLVAVLQLPLGMWLPVGVTFDLGSEAGRHLAELRRCLPMGCLAELALNDTILTALRQDPEGESAIEFAMQPDDPARVPLVHRGFAAAFDAMGRKMSRE